MFFYVIIQLIGNYYRMETEKVFPPLFMSDQGFFFNDIDNHCGRTEVTITPSIILLQSKNKYEDCKNKAPLSIMFLMRISKVSTVLIFDNHIKGHQMESGVVLVLKRVQLSVSLCFQFTHGGIMKPCSSSLGVHCGKLTLRTGQMSFYLTSNWQVTVSWRCSHSEQTCKKSKVQ